MEKKNKPAVSVIIPMFNAEDFIGECLGSLVNQTFQDFEVIVVDDCSTDNSCSIVNYFAEKKWIEGEVNLIKLPKNSGCPGIPRNFALEAARGEYIYFLDADDLLSNKALEELHNVAENFNADVVHVEKCIAFKDGGAVVSSLQTGVFVTEPTLVTSDIGERVTDFIHKRYLWWACNKLFRRQFLLDNKIKFPEVHFFEDMLFAFMCLVTAKNYVRVPFVSYYYRMREDSLSHQVTDYLRVANNLCDIVKDADDFMRGRKFFVENPQYIYLFMDFFVKERLEKFLKSLLADNYNVGEVYDFFYKNIFSKNAQDNAALTTYLFLSAASRSI